MPATPHRRRPTSRSPRRWRPALLLLLTQALILSSCAMLPQWQEASPKTVRTQELDTLPYHPLVYHLDLCVLAYHLYAQSLVWPFDPYYEELAADENARETHIARVRSWAESQGQRQISGGGTGLSAYRGPGLLGGFDDNPRHDPIIYRYDRLYPWSPALTNACGEWIEYLTPAAITDSIGSVHVCYRPAGAGEDQAVLQRLSFDRHAPPPGKGRDILLVFEGGTGDKGEPGQHASQSLMGFVLIRPAPSGGSYDVHIAFRGSRSGSAGRAFLEAFSTEEAHGNPDWITDLGFRQVPPWHGGSPISTVGLVSRGFSTSVQSMFATIFRCLREVEPLAGGRPPENLYVTGHSLGGALAQHFVSALLLGDRYGPAGNGPDMPASLRDWPWSETKLITYGAPRAGDEIWAKRLSERALQSEPFIAFLDPYDRNALPVAHPSIIPRLNDEDRPVGYRVLFSKDPITNGLIGGKHVGRSVYVGEPAVLDALKLWSFEAHEPEEIRRAMCEPLDDPRIPALAWRYRDLMELSPGWNPEARGSLAAYHQLHRAVEDYHDRNGNYHDDEACEREFELFLQLLEAEEVTGAPTDTTES